MVLHGRANRTNLLVGVQKENVFSSDRATQSEPGVNHSAFGTAFIFFESQAVKIPTMNVLISTDMPL